MKAYQSFLLRILIQYFVYDEKGTILYGNEAGASFLTVWKSKIGERAPEHISQIVADVLASNKGMES